jgi:hypothetical protein
MVTTAFVAFERIGARGMQPVRVGISGSYGGLNLGDEAVLEVMVRQLRASVPAEITVFSRDTEDTLRRHDIDHAIPIRQMTRAGGAIPPSLETGRVVPFDPEVFKLTALDLLDDAGVQYLLHAFASVPIRAGRLRPNRYFPEQNDLLPWA